MPSLTRKSTPIWRGPTSPSLPRVGEGASECIDRSARLRHVSSEHRPPFRAAGVVEDGRYGRLIPVGDAKALVAAIVTSERKEHECAEHFSIERARWTSGVEMPYPASPFRFKDAARQTSSAGRLNYSRDTLGKIGCLPINSSVHTDGTFHGERRLLAERPRERWEG
jgi:hypothetical protein